MTDRDHDSAREMLSLALADEPPLRLHADRIASAGRLRLRRRRAGTAGAALAVVGLAVAGFVTAPVGGGPQFAGPTTTTTSEQPGLECGSDPGQRPAGPSTRLPTRNQVTDAVQTALGNDVLPDNPDSTAEGADSSADGPRAKYSYGIGTTATVHLEVSAAGDVDEEMAWAVAAARNECLRPAERTLVGGASAVVTAVPGGHRVVGVGDRLRVHVEATTVDGSPLPVREAEVVALAGRLAGLD